MRKVLISAGHSEKDPGAVNGKYKQATMATLMRDRVASRLKKLGVPVFVDGSEGVNDPLNKAIALAKITSPLAVEIHFNAGSSKATGIEALTKPKNKKFAQDLCLAVSKATGLKLRGELGYKPDDSGQHQRLGFCEAGGTILEVCFISNDNDVESYVKNKEDVASYVADVLLKYASQP